jgi:hypothetical protein
MAQQVTINVNAITPLGAEKIGKLLEVIGTNIDKSALEILANKSKKPGISDKVRQFKNLI